MIENNEGNHSKDFYLPGIQNFCQDRKGYKKSDLVDTPVDKAYVSSHRTQAEFVLAFDTDTTFQVCWFTPAQPVNVYPLNTSLLTLWTFDWDKKGWIGVDFALPHSHDIKFRIRCAFLQEFQR